jgi:hypothetical protein
MPERPIRHSQRFLRCKGRQEPRFTYCTCRLLVQRVMKQNITISVEKALLRKARALAAQRGASISAMLA